MIAWQRWWAPAREHETSWPCDVPPSDKHVGGPAIAACRVDCVHQAWELSRAAMTCAPRCDANVLAASTAPSKASTGKARFVWMNLCSSNCARATAGPYHVTCWLTATVPFTAATMAKFALANDMPQWLATQGCREADTRDARALGPPRGLVPKWLRIFRNNNNTKNFHGPN